MKRIALLFSGQGAQHVGMSKDLAEVYPSIMEMYNKADVSLQIPFKETCFTGPEERLTDTSYCQPALYLHGLALLQIIKEKFPSFTFEATAGLSLGEFTAHAAAGTFSLEEGLTLVAQRGNLMQMACQASNGGMLSLIGATHEQAEQVARESGLEVANYNCPGQVVLSGNKDLMLTAIEIAQKFGIKRAIPLNVAGAYHSSLMRSAQEAFQSFVEQTTMKFSPIHVTSNVTGHLVKNVDEIRDVLLRQVTASVRWEQCIQTLLHHGITHFIELGPGKVLAGLCKRIDKNIACVSIGNLAELEGNIHELN